jgi:hypothetical protein
MGVAVELPATKPNPTVAERPRSIVDPHLIRLHVVGQHQIHVTVPTEATIAPPGEKATLQTVSMPQDMQHLVACQGPQSYRAVVTSRCQEAAIR